MANKVLKLTFADGSNDYKNKTITIKSPRKGLTKETVQTAMNQIVSANAFSFADSPVYAKVISAKYYTSQTDNIFKVDKDA